MFFFAFLTFSTILYQQTERSCF